MSVIFALCLLALGIGSGLMAGMLGVGGGMVIAPFLMALFQYYHIAPPDQVLHVAIATAMSTILFTSLSSMRAHHRKRAVRWSLVAQFVPGLLLGGLLSGGVLFRFINIAFLALIFSLFVAYSAWQMLSNRKPKPSRQLPHPLGIGVVGTIIGAISGLVGAGGGVMAVPFMVWANVPMINAVATSAAMGFPIALANSVGYIAGGTAISQSSPYLLGYIYWPSLLFLVSMSMTFAPIGAKLAHQLPVPKLKRIFGIMLLGISALMLHKALHLLHWV